MIKVLRDGKYELIETSQQVKILYLDKKPLVWLFLPSIGHVLETTHKPRKADYRLATGNYRLYDVKQEPRFSAHQHLELFVGDGQWQGYLLLTGLPNIKNPRSRLVTTNETISVPSYREPIAAF